MKTVVRIFFALVLLAALAGLAGSILSRRAAESEFARQAGLAAEEAANIQRTVVLYFHGRVHSGQNFSSALAGMGIPAQGIGGMLAAARPLFDFRHLRAGNDLWIGRSVMGEFRAVRYRMDPERELWIEPQDSGFHAQIHILPTTVEQAGVAGRVGDSLFNAVTDAGERPELALSLADLFAWDIDFNTETQSGDTFRLVVEKKRYENGQIAAYGRILLAEYTCAGHAFRAVLFHDAQGHPAYYGPDGKALKKAFLRSPLPFAAPVTSHFSYDRFHPILKIHRPHLGTDYGAPEGTPVQTIGSGHVAFAGAKGGEGNMVLIRHTNGYETMYMHLSRILVRNGQPVTQGQRIGLVGHTGLATGPHLDFRIKQNGQFRNFESLKLPPAEPVARMQMPEFISERDHWTTLLPAAGTQLAQAASTAGPAPATPGTHTP